MIDASLGIIIIIIMSCPICYDSNNTNRFWKCNHKFCKTCVYQWRNQTQGGNCPICREPNIIGYRNTFRIAIKYIKILYRYTMYTYRYIKWMLKDLNEFVEEHVATNYDSSVEGMLTPRMPPVVYQGNARDLYLLRLRHGRNVY